MSETGPAKARGEEVLSTAIGRELLERLDEWTTAHPWRLGSQAFPLVVLEATDASVDAGAYIDALAQAAAAADIPHIVLSAPDAPEDAADGGNQGGAAPDGTPPEIALLDSLSKPGAWPGNGPAAGRYRFPRSDLVRSCEEAVRSAAEKNRARPTSTTPAEEWYDAAVLLPWTRRPLTAPVWWSTVIVLVAAIFGGIAQGVADKTRIGTLLTICGILLAAVALAAGLSNRRIWLPVLSRVGFGTRYRWLAASSFFAGQGSRGFDGRLNSQLKQINDALGTGSTGPADPKRAEEAAKSWLQTKTLAFLEDLRARHRKLSFTLRGFKRPVPSVVFLRDITRRNGGVELLVAMSDVRSRRSELHPLLVVASVDHAHQADIGDRLGAAPAAGVLPSGERPETLKKRYEDWIKSLGGAQGPSAQVTSPWLLRLPIPVHTPADATPRPLKPRTRPRWTWLWSSRSLLVLLAALAVGGSYLHAQLTSTHCSVHALFFANTDTQLRRDAAGSRECVGIATGGVRFERTPLSTTLGGGSARPGPAHTADQITLADLEDRIAAENAWVLAGHRPYVTILYVGMLTAAEGQESSAVSETRQLAGAYLAQRGNNRAQAGGGDNPLKIRLLAVNAGQDMAFSKITADRILAMVRRDRTVVGVVGISRNTAESQKAIRRLNAAGLAVLDPVNSSDTLRALPQFYGLAATDNDEATVARKVLGGKRAGRTLIVYRSPGAEGSDYGAELAEDAQRALAAAPSSTMLRYDGTDDIGAKVRAACRGSAGDPYALVYFAGRTEDLGGLINALRDGGCADRELTVLGGDEVSRSRFGTGRTDVLLPRSMTVYYTTFTYLPNLLADGGDTDNPFFVLARNELGIGPEERSALLADGQMVMAYDSASALAQAAERAFGTLDLGAHGAARAPGSASVTSGSVLLTLPNLSYQGATGLIDFTHDQHVSGGSGRRALTLVKVTGRDLGAAPTAVCGQLAGGRPAPGLPPCQ
ncbi:type 1 periplasmic-binding domain-containing protein [Actinoallomurus rhizosphaericola]|uniref:hypothetical protein n=1 Tax=Actinoallomurus rhizosphaericola TaxID=2952536 RepID=UPI002093B5F2|nr:hypothetical protein [Actinoallomurus rhizosphaericola]MCO5997389.1 hypothetical protein [Actinoallomurus rhizosphaericola]